MEDGYLLLGVLRSLQQQSTAENVFLCIFLALIYSMVMIRTAQRIKLILNEPLESLAAKLGISVPAPPEIAVSQLTDSSVSLRWLPAGKNVARYDVFLNGFGITRLLASENSVSISNLQPNTTYRLDVVALSSTNFQSMPASVNIKTRQTHLQALTAALTADHDGPAVRSLAESFIREDAECILSALTEINPIIHRGFLLPEADKRSTRLLLSREGPDIPVRQLVDQIVDSGPSAVNVVKSSSNSVSNVLATPKKDNGDVSGSASASASASAASATPGTPARKKNDAAEPSALTGKSADVEELGRRFLQLQEMKNAIMTEVMDYNTVITPLQEAKKILRDRVKNPAPGSATKKTSTLKESQRNSNIRLIMAKEEVKRLETDLEKVGSEIEVKKERQKALQKSLDTLQTQSGEEKQQLVAQSEELKSLIEQLRQEITDMDNQVRELSLVKKQHEIIRKQSAVFEEHIKAISADHSEQNIANFRQEIEKCNYSVFPLEWKSRILNEIEKDFILNTIFTQRFQKLDSALQETEKEQESADRDYETVKANVSHLVDKALGSVENKLSSHRSDDKLGHGGHGSHGGHGVPGGFPGGPQHSGSSASLATAPAALPTSKMYATISGLPSAVRTPHPPMRNSSAPANPWNPPVSAAHEESTGFPGGDTDGISAFQPASPRMPSFELDGNSVVPFPTDSAQQTQFLPSSPHSGRQRRNSASTGRPTGSFSPQVSYSAGSVWSSGPLPEEPQSLGALGLGLVDAGQPSSAAAIDYRNRPLSYLFQPNSAGLKLNGADDGTSGDTSRDSGFFSISPVNSGPSSSLFFNRVAGGGAPMSDASPAMPAVLRNNSMGDMSLNGTGRISAEYVSPNLLPGTGKADFDPFMSHAQSFSTSSISPTLQEMRLEADSQLLRGPMPNEPIDLFSGSGGFSGGIPGRISESSTSPFADLKMLPPDVRVEVPEGSNSSPKKFFDFFSRRNKPEEEPRNGSNLSTVPGNVTVQSGESEPSGSMRFGSKFFRKQNTHNSDVEHSKLSGSFRFGKSRGESERSIALALKDARGNRQRSDSYSSVLSSNSLLGNDVWKVRDDEKDSLAGHGLLLPGHGAKSFARSSNLNIESHGMMGSPIQKQRSNHTRSSSAFTTHSAGNTCGQQSSSYGAQSITASDFDMSFMYSDEATNDSRQGLIDFEGSSANIGTNVNASPGTRAFPDSMRSDTEPASSGMFSSWKLLSRKKEKPEVEEAADAMGENAEANVSSASDAKSSGGKAASKKNKKEKEKERKKEKEKEKQKEKEKEKGKDKDKDKDPETDKEREDNEKEKEKDKEKDFYFIPKTPKMLSPNKGSFSSRDSSSLEGSGNRKRNIMKNYFNSPMKGSMRIFGINGESKAGTDETGNDSAFPRPKMYESPLIESDDEESEGQEVGRVDHEMSGDPLKLVSSAEAESDAESGSSAAKATKSSRLGKSLRALSINRKGNHQAEDEIQPISPVEISTKFRRLSLFRKGDDKKLQQD